VHVHGKNGFVTATKLETENEIFVASTKNFAATTKRSVDRTKNFVVVTKYFFIPILTNDFVGVTKPFFPCRENLKNSLLFSWFSFTSEVEKYGWCAVALCSISPQRQVVPDLCRRVGMGYTDALRLRYNPPNGLV